MSKTRWTTSTSVFSVYAALYSLIFIAENVAYMHLPFDNVTYSPNSSSNVNYFNFSLM